MKKLTYLLLVMFAVVLMSTSCEEEDVLTKSNDDGIITLTELDGQWNFQSYLYGDGEEKVKITLENYQEYSADYDGIEEAFMNWEFNTKNMTAIKTHAVYTSNYGEYNFTKTDDVLYIEGFVYTIISYNTNELKLSWEDAAYSFDFLGGILTLTK